MSPAEVLLSAADRVQFQGWTQFAYAQDANGKVVGASNPEAVRWCAKGALKAEDPNHFHNAVFRVEDYLGQGNPRWGCDMRIWNDTPGRTAGEVADTMRRVAKELENSSQ